MRIIQLILVLLVLVNAKHVLEIVQIVLYVLKIYFYYKIRTMVNVFLYVLKDTIVIQLIQNAHLVIQHAKLVINFL